MISGMSFRDCLLSAAQQGALDPHEAERLATLHEAEVKAAMARGAADPLGEAKAAVEAVVTEEAKQALRRKALQAAKVDELAAFARDYRDARGRPDVATAFEATLENRNALLAGTPSVVGRRDALIAQAHAGMEQMLYATRRKWGTGGRAGQAQLEAIVRESFGEATGDVAAKGFLGAYRRAVDDLASAFNAAGGAIPLKEHYFPQAHEPAPMIKAGREKWIKDITPLLDTAKMRDPLTGGALTPARLRETLEKSWERIITNGDVDLTPSMQAQGRGALAKQRQEARFLEFKDGDAWLAYNAAYGGGDVHATMMRHVHGLARDVASMEVLGPNPNATVTWMQQVIRNEKARRFAGLDTLHRATPLHNFLTQPDDFLGRLWTVVNGAPHSPNRLSDAIKGTRNWLTAANLSGTALTAVVSDPMQATWARRFAGVPAFRLIADLPRQLVGEGGERAISRAGVVVADAMEHLRTDMGGYGLAAGSKEWARWLPDRVFAWTGLTPWTNAIRRAHAQAFMLHAGDVAGASLAELARRGGQDARFARWLGGFGIGEEHWAAIRAAKGLDHADAGAMIRPVDVMAGGHPLAREAGLRYSEAMHALMEDATPSSTARTRTIMGAHTQEGTVAGEMVRSGTMYLSYPSTVMLSLINAISHEFSGGAAQGIGFAFKTLATLTLGGVAVMQMQQLRAGRDVMKADDPKFWLTALAKGGGLGFYGDYVFADYKRGGGEQAARVAGPFAGFIADALAVANPSAALSEDDTTNRAERLVNLARRNTPVLSMWPLKPIADRQLWDRLQLAANPDAYKSWRRTERRLMKEEAQGTWWRRGPQAPHRLPDFALW